MSEPSSPVRQASIAAPRVRADRRPAACGRCGASARPCHAEPTDTTDTRLTVDLPCQVHDPDLWFAEAPADLQLAKALCARCPARLACLTGAVDRQEAAGVWGGEIFDHGQLVTHKRPRGRPRKNSIPPRRYPARLAQLSSAHPAPECVDEEIDEIAIERAVSGRHRVRLHDLTPAEQDEAVRRLTERGKSIRDIAEHLATTERTIYRRRAALSAAAAPRPESRSNRHVGPT